MVDYKSPPSSSLPFIPSSHRLLIKMQDAQDRRPGRGVPDLPLGFGLRHGLPAGERSTTCNPVLLRLPEQERGDSPSADLRSGSVLQLSTRSKKSPLPAWYPRTPLRDITHIVKAIERRSARLQAASELKKRKQDIRKSPLAPIPLNCPLTCAKPPDQSLFPNLDSPIRSKAVLDSTPKTNHPPKISEQQGEASASSLDDPGPNDDRFHKEKCMELDEMEKAVQIKLQGMKDAATKKKPGRSVLMSMR